MPRRSTSSTRRSPFSGRTSACASTTRPMRSLWSLRSGLARDVAVGRRNPRPAARAAAAAGTGELPRLAGAAAAGLHDARSAETTGGTCRTAARCMWCASSIPSAASPISMKTPPTKSSSQSALNEFTGVQRETLDNLHEGVALFGTDGRLQAAQSRLREFLGPREGLPRQAAACRPHRRRRRASSSTTGSIGTRSNTA